jgi:hypothetical protein
MVEGGETQVAGVMCMDFGVRVCAALAVLLRTHTHFIKVSGGLILVAHQNSLKRISI